MNEQGSAAQWRGAAYADHADHHRAVDDWFLDRLRPHPESVVVDLGPGSGEFSARLAGVVTNGGSSGWNLTPQCSRPRNATPARMCSSSAHLLRSSTESLTTARWILS